MTERHLYLIALSFAPNLKPADARELIEIAEEPSNLFKRDFLDTLPELNPALKKILLQGSLLQCANEELKTIRVNNLNVLSIFDVKYPYRLKECPDAPLILYSKGQCDLNTNRVVSIVGTRNASPYGRDHTRKLVKEIADLDPTILIVSGLAYGIDVIAHQSAMEFGLKTICIFGHGLHTVYPSVHSKYADEMVEKQGANMSELPWGTASEKWRFIQRNRIVAGLCDACVVVESGLTGGSMKTARMARDYNRDVFAYPGRTTDVYSLGCNTLISDMTAGLIQGATDLFQKMSWDIPKNRKTQRSLFVELNDKQLSIFNKIKKSDSIAMQTLASACGWSIQETMTVLMELELEGLIEKRPGGEYRLFLTS
jgi:DNA processing protein